MLTIDEIGRHLSNRVVNLDVPSVPCVVQPPELAAIAPQPCGHAGYLISSTHRCLVCSALTYVEVVDGRPTN